MVFLMDLSYSFLEVGALWHVCLREKCEREKIKGGKNRKLIEKLTVF